ncbi:MAG: diguanylate cyclase [Actinobacteria bacterium]|nr:diguanylate cyclase [Actinomycetota bacterium]
MTSCLRAADAVGRLGGEEFVILFPGADTQAAAGAGERIRRALADSTIATAGGHVRITASLGIATRTAEDGTPTSVLGRADEALYTAKAAGRNRVKTSGEVALVES